MLLLYRSAFNMMLPFSSHFFGARSLRYTAPPTVIADAIYRHVIDDRLVVHPDVRDVHVVYCTVVGEATMIPIAAFITMADVSETIIHSAIESNVRTPISGMPQVGAASPSPIAWCPEKTNLGGHDPCARNPIIAVITICPITRRPDITVTGAKRLRINRQRWGCNVDRNKNARKGWRR
jgi:hypothetical protein